MKNKALLRQGFGEEPLHSPRLRRRTSPFAKASEKNLSIRQGFGEEPLHSLRLRGKIYLSLILVDWVHRSSEKHGEDVSIIVRRKKFSVAKAMEKNFPFAEAMEKNFPFAEASVKNLSFAKASEKNLSIR